MVVKSAIAVFAAIISLAIVPVARSVEIPVVVGGSAGLVYTPSSVTANVGDVVVFSFRPNNHTVTQSTFESPCVQASGGFDSGFTPVAATNTNGPFPAARFTVTDLNPVWVYCRQTGHCQQGMVFAINPGSQFAAFQNAAKGITTTATAAPTSSATATATNSAGTASPTTDHLVVVGGPGQLIYSPSNITAQVGDTVTFQFMQKNHTVTQSSFAVPCSPLAQTSTSGQVGFDSGFMPVADTATTFPTYTITVNNTSPIWAFCRQTNHCSSGMVFAVNSVESGPNNFAAFKAKAMSGGTSTSTSSSAKPTNGASTTSTRWRAGIMLSLVAAVMGALL